VKITPSLQKSAEHFEKAYSASRNWNELIERAIKIYGDKSKNLPHISGIYAEHFPEEIKNSLVAYCQTVNTELKAAYSARPKGVHFRTMIKLKDFIKSRDGSGYYG